jgi:hypothetical protein
VTFKASITDVDAEAAASATHNRFKRRSPSLEFDPNTLAKGNILVLDGEEDEEDDDDGDGDYDDRSGVVNGGKNSSRGGTISAERTRSGTGHHVEKLRGKKSKGKTNKKQSAAAPKAKASNDVYRIAWHLLRLEPRPFAKGGSGRVFRGKYMGNAIAAKQVLHDKDSINLLPTTSSSSTSSSSSNSSASNPSSSSSSATRGVSGRLSKTTKTNSMDLSTNHRDAEDFDREVTDNLNSTPVRIPTQFTTKKTIQPNSPPHCRLRC